MAETQATKDPAMGLLERHIRDGAEVKLKNQVSVVFDGPKDLLYRANWPYVQIKVLGKEEPLNIQSSDLMEAIKKRVIEVLTPEVGDRAVREFITRVDSLQSEVEALRDEVTGGR